MSFGRETVDYGPIALPVGAIREANVVAPRSSSLEADANKLFNLLSKVGSERKTADFEHSGLMTSSDGRGKSDQIPDELELGPELERLWVCNGNGNIREVRLRLADTLIPSTWVRIFTHGGELQIELSAALDGTRQWLGQSSMKLAEDIGNRLQCPVRVIVRGVHGTEANFAVFPWEGGHS